MLVKAIRAISEYIAVRQDQGLATGLPRVDDYVTGCMACGAFVVSFNYDLFVEKTADRYGFGYRDSRVVRAFSLLKPHGSLDVSWMPGKPGSRIHLSLLGARDIAKRPHAF
jgi:hypothetical protein